MKRKQKHKRKLIVVLGLILSMFIQPLSPVMGQLHNDNDIQTTSDVKENYYDKQHTSDENDEQKENENDATDHYDYYDLDLSDDDVEYINDRLDENGWAYVDGFLLVNSQGYQLPQPFSTSGQVRARVNRMSNATYWTRHINIPGIFYGTHPVTGAPRNPWGFEHWQAYVPNRGWVTAFCTQPGVPSVWAGDIGGGWTPNNTSGSAWNDFSIAQRWTIEAILMFGYGYFHGVSGSQTNDDSIIATQVAITEVALGLWTVETPWTGWANRNNPSSNAWHFNERLIRTTGTASGLNIPYWNGFEGAMLNHTQPIGNQARIDRYNAIRNDIWTFFGQTPISNRTPQFAFPSANVAQQTANVHTLTWHSANQRYQVTLTDAPTNGGNGILNRFITLNVGQSTTFGAYTVERTGSDTIIVHTTNPNAVRTVSPATLMQVTPPNEIPLVWWHHPDMQDKVTGNFVDPLTAFFAVEVEAIGNLEIIKYSETGVRIPNTQFRITGNGINTTVTTNSNGVATLTNIPVGTYTVTEISVPLPYLLDPTPRTITVAPHTNQIATNRLTFTNERIRGGVQVPKIDRERDINISQGEATLQGAEIAIINRSNEPVRTLDGRLISYGEIKGTIITGVDGIARTSQNFLQAGTYELREIRAPRGYLINNEWSYTFTISEHHVIIESTNALPQQVIRGGVEIEKADRELSLLERLGNWTGLRPVQGDATLIGIQFDITNVSTSGNGGDGSVMVNGQLFQVGDVVYSIFTDYEVRGSELRVFARTPHNLLPFGTFEIQEVATNDSYLLTDGEPRRFEVRENGVIVTGTIDGDDLLFLNYILRGDVEVEKWDIELDASEAMAGTTLEGIEFEIINKSTNPVLVDGNVFEVNEVIMSIFTLWCDDSEAYIARTTGRTLPYGTYRITEVRGNTYYLLEEEINRPPLSFTFEIREDGETVRHDVNRNKMIFKNQVRRGDLSAVKIAETTAQRLSNIPFAITNHASQETNVIVTDTNGEFSTHHSWNQRRYANVNNHVLENEASGELIMNDDLNMYGSVWFGIGEFGTTAPVHNTLGALPYGWYTVREMRAENNIGFDLLEFDIFVSRHGHIINLGTLTNINEPQPDPDPQPDFSIGTQAHTGDGSDQYFLVGETFTAYDDVLITHINVPEGTLMSFRAFLWERMTDGSARLIFYTDYQDYTVENVEELFTITSNLIDSNELEGEYLFWSETLYTRTIDENDEVERNLVYEHNKNGSDTRQKLHPVQPDPDPQPDFSIGTQAHTGDGSDQYFLVGETFTAHDDVLITHINVPEGTLMSFRAFLWERMTDGSARLIFYTDYQDYTVENVEELFTITSNLIDSNELEGEYLFWSETLYTRTIDEDGEVERELVYEHNKDGEDVRQKLHPRKEEPQPEPKPNQPVPSAPTRPGPPPLPQTGSTAMNIILFAVVPLAVGGTIGIAKMRTAKKSKGNEENV